MKDMTSTFSGLLTNREIEKYLDPDQPINKRLFISPLLDDDQVGRTSIDLHVGHHFLYPKPSQIGELDVVRLHNSGLTSLTQIYGESYVPYGKYFMLHPRRSVQIGTLEYLGLPNDLEGFVSLRASASTLPLILNLVQVHPGHRGIISLTVTSNADFSTALYPGMTIAELKLIKTSSLVREPKGSRYHNLTRPTVSALHGDSNLDIIGPTIEPLIIGIASTLASGRTEAINYLIERFGFSSFLLSQILKSEARKHSLPPTRTNLQKLGKTLRETYGHGYLAVKLRSSAAWLTNENDFVIVDGFKNRGEVHEFRKQGNFRLIGIDADVKARWQRMKSRRRIGDPKEKKAFIYQDSIDRGLVPVSDGGQEVQYLLDNEVDHLIRNDGELPDFLKQFEELVKGLVYPGVQE